MANQRNRSWRAGAGRWNQPILALQLSHFLGDHMGREIADGRALDESFTAGRHRTAELPQPPTGGLIGPRVREGGWWIERRGLRRRRRLALFAFGVDRRPPLAHELQADARLAQQPLDPQLPGAVQALSLCGSAPARATARAAAQEPVLSAAR